MGYEVYEDEFGEWGFRVVVDGVECAGGAGFPTEEEAQEMAEEVAAGFQVE